jgi:hypothetical protein
LDGQLEEAANGDENIRQQAREQLVTTIGLLQQLESFVAQILAK